MASPGVGATGLEAGPGTHWPDEAQHPKHGPQVPMGRCSTSTRTTTGRCRGARFSCPATYLAAVCRSWRHHWHDRDAACIAATQPDAEPKRTAASASRPKRRATPAPAPSEPRSSRRGRAGLPTALQASSVMAAVKGRATFTRAPKRQRVPAGARCACELHVRRQRRSFETSLHTVPVAHFTALEHSVCSAATGSCFRMHTERAPSRVIVSGHACDAEQGCEQ